MINKYPKIYYYFIKNNSIQNVVNHVFIVVKELFKESLFGSIAILSKKRTYFSFILLISTI